MPGQWGNLADVEDEIPESFYNRLLHECRCGWKRYFTPNDDWRNRIIAHPIYGARENMVIAQLDVKNHHCETAVSASIRQRRRNHYV